MGPMRAACRFAQELDRDGLLDRVTRVQTDLYGSLALTGMGHATDRAVLLGLAGNEPETIDPAAIESKVAAIRGLRHIESRRHAHDCIRRAARPPLPSRPDVSSRRRHQTPQRHAASPPSMPAAQSSPSAPSSPSAADSSPRMEKPIGHQRAAGAPAVSLPQRRRVAGDRSHALALHRPRDAGQRMRASARLDRTRVRSRRSGRSRIGIERIWQTMQDCIERGMATEGILPEA